jgi:hypothetical protein
VLVAGDLGVRGVAVAVLRTVQSVVENAYQVVVLVPCPRRTLAEVHPCLLAPLSVSTAVPDPATAQTRPSAVSIASVEGPDEIQTLEVSPHELAQPQNSVTFYMYVRFTS